MTIIGVTIQVNVKLFHTFEFLKKRTLYQTIRHHKISSYIHVFLSFEKFDNRTETILSNVIEHNKFFYNDTYYPYIGCYYSNTQP